MQKNQKTYRIAAYLLIGLTSLLIVTQSVFSIINAHQSQSNDNDEAIVKVETEAVLPIIVLPFSKAVFYLYGGLVFILLLSQNIKVWLLSFYKTFNAKIFGSICMNGP